MLLYSQLTPSSLVPIDHSELYTFRTLYKCETIVYAFLHLSSSLRVCFWIHPYRIYQSFLLFYCWLAFLSMNIKYFTHLKNANGHQPSMNIGVWVFLWHMFLFLLDRSLGEFLDHMVNIRNWHLFYKVIYHFRFFPAVYGRSSITLSSMLGVVSFYNFRHKVRYHCSFNYLHFSND